MERLADYTKWTMAYAVAVLLYVPAEFLPAEGWVGWVAPTATLLAGVSAVFGALLMTHIVAILARNETTGPWVATWGRLHLWPLVVAFVLVGVLFLIDKVIRPTAAEACEIVLPTEGGRSVTLSLACEIEAS